MERKLATVTIDLKNSKDRKEEIAAWLHSLAEEIKNIDETKYVDKPKWNYYTD